MPIYFRAKAALRECNEVLSPRFESDGQLKIAFQGLGHFNNQVMFAKIKDEDSIVEKLYDIAGMENSTVFYNDT